MSEVDVMNKDGFKIYWLQIGGVTQFNFSKCFSDFHMWSLNEYSWL